MLGPKDMTTERKKPMEPKIYILDEKEVHMIGEYVGVVWSVTKKQKTIKGEDGVTYRAEVPVRDGDPYIDFISIREDNYPNGDTETYEDEDSPVQGGLSVSTAAKIAVEIHEAIQYYNKVTMQEGK